MREDAKDLAEFRKRLSQNPNDRLQVIAALWADETKKFKARLVRTPELNIPEIGLLDDFAWFRLADRHGDLTEDDEFSEAASEAREKAKEIFAHYLTEALLAYAKANDGQIPKQLLDLKPFFRLPGDMPLDISILQRYELVQVETGKLSDAPKGALIRGEDNRG